MLVGDVLARIGNLRLVELGNLRVLVVLVLLTTAKPIGIGKLLIFGMPLCGLSVAIGNLGVDPRSLHVLLPLPPFDSF